MSEKLVAITGATGFLGRHILRAVYAAGHRPVAIVRNRAAARDLLPDNIELRQADITDSAAVTKAFSGVDAAIHVAGMVSVSRRDTKEIERINISGARNFLMAGDAAGVRRMLFTSTTSAVAALSDDTPDRPCDETAAFNLATVPVAYIQAKRIAHELALAAQDRGQPVVILSPCFVLGPDDINVNSSELVEAVRTGRLPICPRGGINPVDVRDIAQAYVAALDHPDPAPHYILASRENLTLKDFIGRVADLALVSPPRLSLPGKLQLAIAAIAERVYPAGPVTTAGLRLGSYYWYFSAGLARRELGLVCRPLEETLQATLDWLVAKEKNPQMQI
ncbi:MAG: NAD-dependent epimerase/dehydratase family protein [Alphaproteobacteria bacterium]|nr:NAD-dependent epimerase/dehydratase family protein [Alphaproteobacteria bacterium]